MRVSWPQAFTEQQGRVGSGGQHRSDGSLGGVVEPGTLCRVTLQVALETGATCLGHGVLMEQIEFLAAALGDVINAATKPHDDRVQFLVPRTRREVAERQIAGTG